jgi:hypothetical protein
MKDFLDQPAGEIHKVRSDSQANRFILKKLETSVLKLKKDSLLKLALFLKMN